MNSLKHTDSSSLPDYNNIDVLHRNRLAPRAYFNSDPGGWDLSGKWKFRLLDCPGRVSPDYLSGDFTDDDWDDINVPSCWQMEGFGHMHYTDLHYTIPLRVPFVPTMNPTGVYRRRFRLEKMDSRDYILRFYGVDSAFHVYLNGRMAGYSQGSRMMSEFDIASHLCDGENSITVVVYKWCNASYLEDQDTWWFSGIFRKVEIISAPPFSIWDYSLESRLSGGAAEICVELSFRDAGGPFADCMGEYSLRLGFEGHGENLSEICMPGSLEWSDAGQLGAARYSGIWKLRGKINKPQLWSAEKPFLYNLCLELRRGDEMLQSIQEDVGIRQVEIRGNRILLNEKPIMFRGVNRHDFNCDTGRTVSLDDMERDIVQMKRHNINAVRSSHYPNLPQFYQFCDKYGLYVVAEADLECHGFELSDNYARLSTDPLWGPTYESRALRLVHPLKNRSSVLMWSLGNESDFGENFARAAKAIRAVDAQALVHYEGDVNCEVTDVFSTMYTSVENLEKTGCEEGKPHVLCEYAHAMGNGPGSLKEYQEVFEKYDRLHGGFIWEWMDQGVRSRDNEGREFFCFGGDYQDEPNDGNFVMDGLLFPDRKPSPALYELKKIFEPLQIESVDMSSGHFVLENKQVFRGLEGLAFFWEIKQDAERLFSGVVESPRIPPGEVGDFYIEMPEVPREKLLRHRHYCLNIRVGLKDSELWAEEGYEIAFFQFALPWRAPAEPSTLPESGAGVSGTTITGRRAGFPVPEIKEKDLIEFRGDDFHVVFDGVSGALLRYRFAEQDMILSSPVINFWRAPIDNDKKLIDDWKKKYLLHVLKQDPREPRWNSEGNSFECNYVLASANQQWFYDVRFLYRVLPAGVLVLEVEGKLHNPGGVLNCCLPRMGVNFNVPKELSHVTWYGNGPHESYVDSRHSVYKDVHSMSVSEMMTSYPMPQENGNRSGVEWASISRAGKGLVLSSPEEFHFSAHHYLDEDFERASHVNELRERDFVRVRVDWGHNGLGSNSCGPGPLPQHQLRPRDFQFTFALAGMRRDNVYDTLDMCHFG